MRISGKLDFEEAAPAIAQILMFLALRWDAIARVAAGLLKDGKLTARQVRAQVPRSDVGHGRL